MARDKSWHITCSCSFNAINPMAISSKGDDLIMWIQRLMRTALISLLTMTILARESEGDAEAWVKFLT